MNAQILIRTADCWFEFSRSRTGQLDFVGKAEKVSEAELLGFHKIASSTYFSPSHYIFLHGAVSANPVVYAADNIDLSDKDTFDYLVHIGALLAAVEAKDSLLAGELYLRRRSTFDKFAQITSYILGDLCAELLFSLCYGRIQNVEPEEIPLMFNCAKKKLGFDSSRESLEQAFMRYFRQKDVTLTLPLVGTNFYHLAA